VGAHVLGPRRRRKEGRKEGRKGISTAWRTAVSSVDAETAVSRTEWDNKRNHIAQSRSSPPAPPPPSPPSVISKPRYCTKFLSWMRGEQRGGDARGGQVGGGGDQICSNPFFSNNRANFCQLGLLRLERQSESWTTNKCPQKDSNPRRQHFSLTASKTLAHEAQNRAFRVWRSEQKI
jgi:hypothetical protein